MTHRSWVVDVVIPVLLVGCRFELPALDVPDTPIDAPVDDARVDDASIDGSPVDGSPVDTPVSVCFGASNGLVKPCFPTAPSGDLTLPASIDTDSPSLCSTVVTGADGFCVIAAKTILVKSVIATGGKPLVLVAKTYIYVLSMLDVASHHSAIDPFETVQVGAGSDPRDGCGPGNPALANGGGAGGSFIRMGGDGGNLGGFSAGPRTATTLRGGCRGQDGVTGVSGQGGHGGGAVYLIADAAIFIDSSGAINASGEGGHPGLAGSAGGGGGGSGGMIVFDAPEVFNFGVVFANGGSGGEGSDVSMRGNPGPEPDGAAQARRPDNNTDGGGDGGSGGAGGTAGGDPDGGGGGDGTYGGGGAGGATGVIHVYRGKLPGQVSPTPTQL